MIHPNETPSSTLILRNTLEVELSVPSPKSLGFRGVQNGI